MIKYYGSAHSTIDPGFEASERYESYFARIVDEELFADLVEALPGRVGLMVNMWANRDSVRTVLRNGEYMVYVNRPQADFLDDLEVADRLARDDASRMADSLLRRLEGDAKVRCRQSSEAALKTLFASVRGAEDGS